MESNLSLQSGSWRRAASCRAGALVVALAASQAPAQTVLREWRGVAQQPPDQFGRTMAGVGDVDRDGVPDIAIGAPDTRIGTLDYAGRVYVFSGLDGRQLFAIDGPVAQAQRGARVAAAGDVDRDGHADILIGDFLGTHLVSGRTGTIALTQGMLHSYVGDLDGDGWSDLLLGTRNPLLANAGSVDLITGRTGAIIHQWASTYPNEYLGGHPAGDFDGDGVPDVLIASVVGSTGNGFWVYSGRTFGLLLRAPALSSSFPTKLAALGDVDGDGLDDVGVSDHGFQFAFHRVQAYGFGSSTPLFTLSAPHWIGDSLSAAGDVDGDGYDDILTGGRGTGGHITLFSGRDQSILAHITGGANNNPWNCAGVGDTNGDDFPDFLAGSFWVAPVGAVRLFSGAPAGVTTLGSGCAGASGQVPRIGCTYVPARGSPFRINLSRVRPGASAFLAMGSSATSWNGVPLPTDLTALGMPGCLLLTAPDSVAAATTSGPAGKGRAHHAMVIPATPSLQNATFHAQWFVLEPPGAATVATSTRALQIRIQ